VAFFLFATVRNLALVFGWFAYQKRSSLVLIIGGLAGLFGLLILPIALLNRLFWLPPLVDIGAPYGAALAFVALRKLRGGMD
jgi:hypothetical protein